MERYRTYDGRHSAARRRRSSLKISKSDRSARRVFKLAVCAGIFVVAAGVKLLFPSAMKTVGDELNAVVNYKAAFTAIGEGISGDKKFTAALGEALTYAFSGSAPTQDGATPAPSATNDAAPTQTDGQSSADDTTGDGGTVETFAETDGSAETKEVPSKSEAFTNAVVSAFVQSQEQYSDYAIPAGVTYDMPKLGIAYTKPVDGVVSSGFGFRMHPTDNTVKFHYGTDIAADAGTSIVAFADGKVIAAGQSATLGNYVILSHSDIETLYAHCGKINVKSGQAVKKGDPIATVGMTGNATDTCLHFEIKVSGVSVNPEYYVTW
ncbi:M23 family metallopeptidase [Oscillospiraceae bacterium WX1]